MPTLTQILQLAPASQSSAPSTPIDLSEYAKQSDLIALGNQVAQTYDWVVLPDSDALIRLKPVSPNPIYKFAFVTRARATSAGINIWAIYKLRPLYTGEDPNTPRSYAREEIFAEDTWQTVDLQPLTDKDAELTAALNTLQTALAAQDAKNSNQDAAITTLQGQRNDLKSAIDGYDELFARVEQRLKDADTALGVRIDSANTAITERALQSDLTNFQQQQTDSNQYFADEIKKMAIASDLVTINTALGARIDAKLDRNQITVETVDYYLGNFNDQAGDNASVGHQFTQLSLIGTNITTSDNRLFTLARGVYEIKIEIARHQAGNTWRATTLRVDNVDVTSTYSGHDGGNWNGGGSLTWVVDARLANKTIRVYRNSSTGNGNAAGMLSINRLPGSNIVNCPAGTTFFTPRNITGPAFSPTIGRDNTLTTIAVPNIPNGQEIIVVGATGGATALIRDSGKRGTAYIDVIPNGADTILTFTQSAWTPSQILIAANAGVAVNLGSLKFRMSTNTTQRCLQVASNTDAAISITASNTVPSSTGGSPAGSGLVNLTLAADGAFQNLRNYHLSGQGQTQQCQINDTTNNRSYFLVMEVGTSYMANVFSGFEVSR